MVVVVVVVVVVVGVKNVWKDRVSCKILLEGAY